MRGVSLAMVVAAVGCGSPAESRLEAVEPSVVSYLVATPAVVRGVGLFATAHVDVGADPATLDHGWRVRVGATDMSDVSWRDPQQLDVIVPRGIAPGTYDLIAIAPNDTELALPGGLTVTAEPLGLTLAIEDAGGGAGQPIAGTLAAGDTITAFAVARDAAGGFVSDVSVDWSTTSSFGTVTPGPAASTPLTATTVGTGRVVATRSGASLVAQSGDLVVIAGPASRLAIEDSADGTGLVIADRSGLTTDPSGGLAAFAIGRDRFGNFAGNPAATWTLTGVVGSLPAAAAPVVSIDFATAGIGVLHAAAAPGTAQTGNLVVEGGRAAQLTISPNTLSISADAAPITFSATATDGDGNPTTNVGTLTWSVASGAITALATDGTFDPQHAATGTVTIASTFGATATSGPITVTPGAATVLAIVPPSLSINADDIPVTFTATGSDGDGNATTNLGTIGWSIASGPITALGSTTGVIDPQHAGIGSIAATSSLGPSQTAPVTISAGRAATLTVAPDTVDVVAGGSAVAFSLTAADGDGNATTDLGAVTWSKTGSFAAIDEAGTLVPTTPGTGTVRATSSYGPVDDSGTVHVRRAAALTAALAAPPAVSQTFTATVTLTLTNTGESDAVNVLPCTLVATAGPGAVTIGPPTPATAITIAAGTSEQIVWTITGQTVGSVQLSTCGIGADATTGAPAASQNATTSTAVRSPASLVSTISMPSLIGRGTELTVTMQVTNTGMGPATGVTPSALSMTGTSTVALVAGASGGASIAAGGNASFTYTYSASALGTVQLAGNASGTDSTSGTPISSLNALSNLADVVEAHVVDLDPFGDGSTFGFVCAYHDEVLVGPNATGTRAVALRGDGSIPHSFSFSISADLTGRKSLNSSPAPYPSIGATGCVANSSSCGPDNEDGRGTFTSVTISGSEWIVAAGAHAPAKNTQSVYMTTDTAPVLSFSYVDLSSQLVDHSLGFSAIAAVNNTIYLGAAGDDKKRPRLIALQTMPSPPGLDATAADATDLKVSGMSGIQAGAIDKIDAMTGFANRLYLANDGVWARATVATPRDYAANPTDWALITPTASAYSQKASRTSAKNANFEPSDRAVPQMAAFGDRLFVGRNTTTGPQLWSCQPTTMGDPAQCDSGDWTLVAPNTASCVLCAGDTKLSEFDDGSLSSISMVVATPSFLYIGYDSPNGVIVFRTANPAASTQADFEGAAGCSAAQHVTGCNGYGGAGLGDPTTTRIFDAKVLTLAGHASVWITAGSSTTPLALVELP